MLTAFFLALRQLNDRAFASVFLKSLGVTLMVLAALGVGLWFGLHAGLPALGGWLADFGSAPDAPAAAETLGWLGRTLRAAGESPLFASVVTVVLSLLAYWLLFRAVAIAVIGLFADEIVQAVEARFYPEAHARARDVPLARSIGMGLGSTARAILLNLLFAPTYILFAPVAPFVFFALNAWLLGRDLGDMVAARHVPKPELPQWRARTPFRRFALGAAVTGMLLVPIINLLAPVIGAAMATHIFHRRSSI